ncbi:hypothetical protein R2F61_00430 [Mollicutes bacterium LVI A0078]|nr:hypothetical protein RZE84_00435 [Mollicutes bacterium LVI A0075]WOO91046.1 hypothetical protein R2F61_00430 [Mollicutes bacterium LVI A0078]
MYNYFVGIEIVKDDHFVAVLNSSQEIVVPAFSFKYNIEGFENLQIMTLNLKPITRKRHKKASIIVLQLLALLVNLQIEYILS